MYFWTKEGVVNEKSWFSYPRSDISWFWWVRSDISRFWWVRYDISWDLCARSDISWDLCARTEFSLNMVKSYVLSYISQVLYDKTDDLTMCNENSSFYFENDLSKRQIWKILVCREVLKFYAYLCQFCNTIQKK